MKLSTAQIIARLHYANHVCSWANVHAEMKSAMRTLIRKGLAHTWDNNNAFGLTQAGEGMLAANKSLMTGGKHDSNGAYQPVVVTGAKYWTDQWNQQIPH